ncbi:MAG: methionyl-tRNA formyltransferase [Collinsella sp.]|nr:methionyl-tRNA formyltransferase [Collinsella sp.]
MRIVFMGTPRFAVPSLRRLAASHDIRLVLTRPDAVRSRGKRLEPSPVKEAAIQLGLPVLEANRMTDEVMDELRAAQADVFCVAAYGCILPDEVLTMAPLGCVNVHASLLPRWRGAAPIQRCILEGDAKTGVSIMRIGKGVDTGDYCAQASCSVSGKTADELTDELADLGASLLADVLPALADGSVEWVEQDPELVTHAAKILKTELRLDPDVPTAVNLRRVLASSDAAPARCLVLDRALRVLGAGLADGTPVPPAEVRIDGEGVLLGCSEGVLRLDLVKPDGKREMDASAWAAGTRAQSGSWGRLS